MSDTHNVPDRPPPPPAVRNLEFKAALLLALLLLLIGGAAAYLLYARGVFEPTQRLVLIAENSEGVSVGMDLTFAGFPVGRVRSIELAGDGNARILVDVPRKEAHWLRETSVFTLVRGLVGNTSLRAFTGIPTDPPLRDGAERRVLIGDATAEIPRLVSDARELLQNLAALSGPESPLAQSLDNVRETTERLKGPRGALGAVFGNETDARKLLAVLDRTNALLARVDGLAAKTDAQVFGADGVLKETRDTIVQLNGALADARNTLKRADALLAEAQAIAVNARGATDGLDTLRGEVDASLRKVQQLVDEIARKWPFARDTELKLP